MRRSTRHRLISRTVIGGATLALIVGHCAALAQATSRIAWTEPGSSTTTLGERVVKLLSESTSADDRLVVAAALGRGSVDPLCVGILARIAVTPNVPMWAADALIAASGASPESEYPGVAGALASLRTRKAAWALLSMAERATGREARLAAFDGLLSITGCDTLGRDTAAWSSWLNAAEGWTDAQWQSTTARNQSARAARLAAENSAAISSLLATLRKAHLATPVDKRPEFLVELLGDALNDVKRLGLELAAQELASANPLTDSVSEAATGLLASKSADLRRAAASFLAQRPGPSTESGARSAMERETDPGAAAELWRLVARWPAQELIERAVGWIQVGHELSSTNARDAAMEYLWATQRRGLLYDTPDIARVLTALRLVPTATLPPAGCLLRAMIGTELDLREVAGLLATGDGAQKLAAAEALVSEPQFLDAILAAAGQDPQLNDVAVRGVVLHRQSLEGFAGVASLTLNRPEYRRTSLTKVARMLPSTDVLGAADMLAGEPAMREAVLQVLTSETRISSERRSSTQLSAIAAGLISLAKLRLDLDKPADAVSAVDALPEMSQLRDAGELAAIRAVAFIELDRLDQAEATGAAASAWLDALHAVIAKPQGRAVAVLIEKNFGGTLTDVERTRFEELRAMLPALTQSPDLPDEPGAPPTSPDPPKK
ncbi:MAG: hypothetical protein AABZ53_09295 [Planctomycetota bacterium]